MAKYKAYGSYKSSGIEWLGKIPEHWEVRRLGTFGKFSKGGGISRAELVSDGIAAILYGDIYTKYNFNAVSIINKISENTAKNSVKLEYGDLLFTGSGETKEDIGKCIAFLSESETYAGGDVIIFKKTLNDSRFLSYSLNSKGAIYQKFLAAKGDIIVHIYSSKLRDILIPIPPLQEQTSIARFLDYKLAKINRFIRKKKQLIKLLNEQKAAIINQAVTKGLDPHAPMKESGIEWLGEVPEHWEVRKLKYVADFRSGEMITSETISRTGDYPVFGGGGFRGYTNSFTNEGHHVLIGRQGALCGNVKFANGKFWASEHAIVTYPKIKIDTVYLGEILGVANLGNLSQTAAQPGISIGQIKHVKAPIPPLLEQNQIVAHIETETALLNTTIAKIEKEIALVEEYKTALIAEAVTGKIDVRGYAVPELTEEEDTNEEMEDVLSLEEEETEEYQTEETA